MVIQGISIFLWFILIPFYLGVLLLGLFKREQEGMALSCIVGYITMFALFEIMAIPMILTRQAFHSLVYLAAGVYLALVLASVILFGKKSVIMMKQMMTGIIHLPWTMYTAASMVALQCYFYIRYMVTNLDDAYYVAVASIALQYDTMYQRSPYTGRVVTEFNTRYVCSPYSMLQAFWAKCTGIPAATIAHTILPPVLVCVAYMVYYCMGKELFAQRKLDQKCDHDTEKLTGLFITLMSVINITSYYNMRNQGSVLLVRIWQGKATLAAVLLPFLFLLLYQMAENEKTRGNVCILFLLMLSCCFVSSMGVALAPVMAGVFALLFGMFRKKWRYFFQLVMCCSPCVVIGLCYLLLKAAQE